MRTRILLLTKGLGRGGTEHLLIGALKHFDRARFEFEVAYVLPWKDALVPIVREMGVPVHCLGTGRHGGLAWVARLRRLVRAGDFDIVHTHMPYPAVVARLALGGGPPAIIHTEHNVWERYRAATRWANRLTYRRNAAVLAVSQGVADSIRKPRILRRRPYPSVEVLIHGLDADAICRGDAARAHARSLLGFADDELVIGTVGNLTAKKDHSMLLKALALLVPDHPGVRLAVLGSGPLEGALRAQARSLHLDSQVVWAGSRSDVLELLPGFDVFALSSRYEGLSIALLEAEASGLPCVATSVGGVPEILRDGQHGFLVPPGDPALMAVAIGKLLGDPGLRREFGEAASKNALRFSAVEAVDRLQEIYDSAVQPR